MDITTCMDWFQPYDLNDVSDALKNIQEVFEKMKSFKHLFFEESLSFQFRQPYSLADGTDLTLLVLVDLNKPGDYFIRVKETYESNGQMEMSDISIDIKTDPESIASALCDIRNGIIPLHNKTVVDFSAYPYVRPDIDNGNFKLYQVMTFDRVTT